MTQRRKRGRDMAQVAEMDGGMDMVQHQKISKTSS